MRAFANACSRRTGDCVGMAAAGCVLVVLSSSGGDGAEFFREAGRWMAAAGLFLTAAAIFGGRMR